MKHIDVTVIADTHDPLHVERSAYSEAERSYALHRSTHHDSGLCFLCEPYLDNMCRSAHAIAHDVRHEHF